MLHEEIAVVVKGLDVLAKRVVMLEKQVDDFKKILEKMTAKPAPTTRTKEKA